ncbi:MAG TPA: sugar phosphate isomerase/epimerase family protein [Chitinophagaceae bacterium]|nr:sugar phosphate isomerase/epimerase family protein [Chitinophagaceae bacterium]
MNLSTRKEFLQTSAILLAGTFAGASFDFNKTKPLLSFSTLGCPDWDFKKITDFAVQNGYAGIEIRGLLREMDLTKCKEFITAADRSATMSIMKEKDLRFVDLGSSSNMHVADATERKKNLDEGRRFIDLAQQINCPYVRVFPNGFPKDQDRSQTMDLIINGLLELGDYAKGSHVSVLMETHGDLTRIEDLEKIMRSAAHEHIGLVWDVTNMWTITKESPVEVYNTLKRYIRHTHIKDAKLVDDKVQYVLMGQGDVPIFEAIDALATGGYKGYYSFEWEKLWHPEIAEPQIALADFPKAMRNHFK